MSQIVTQLTARLELVWFSVIVALLDVSQITFFACAQSRRPGRCERIVQASRHGKVATARLGARCYRHVRGEDKVCTDIDNCLPGP
jgi:hypothetical protein